MPCFHRRKAWRTPGGVSFKAPAPGRASEFLLIPCGNCIGCRQARARDWMVRCQLELRSHLRACWVTLTYAEEHLPPTLSKRHLSGFVKRLRARLAERKREFRFFGCGEYGEKRGRPHYHVILFGLSEEKRRFDAALGEYVGHDDAEDIGAAWPFGHVRVDRLEPAAIAYVAGYSAKKIGDHRKTWVVEGEFERLDRETGEVSPGVFRNVIYQAPFLLMSRNPGIAGDARKFWRSWKSTAIWDGAEVRVPRYLHEAFKKSATPEDVARLEKEKDAYLSSVGLDSQLRERAGEKLAEARYALKLSARGKL